MCIECGNVARELYKDFHGGVIKISHCEKCSGVVDKYVEYDPVIVFLDAILHKPQTYRHLLFNIDTSSAWKLVLIFLVCDTNIKWVNRKTPSSSSTGGNHTDKDYLFYAAFEAEIYSIFLTSVIEWIILCVTIIGTLNILSMFRQRAPTSKILPKPFSKASFVFLHRVLAVSSFGKLLAIPAVIWGQKFGLLYLPLTKVLTFTSNLTALRVAHNASRPSLIFALLLGHSTQYVIGESMIAYLYNES